MKTILDRLVECEALAWRYLVAASAWELGGGEPTPEAKEVAVLHTWLIARISLLSDAVDDEQAA
jgi:hypothetical protein